MKCHVCGSALKSVITTLPFKAGDNVVVILKQLPAWQCTVCREYLLEDAVMARVEEFLGTGEHVAELEVIQFGT